MPQDRPVDAIAGSNTAENTESTGAAGLLAMTESAIASELFNTLPRVAAGLLEHHLRVLSAKGGSAERLLITETQRARNLPYQSELRMVDLYDRLPGCRLWIV